jgi:acyl carrier protein
MTRNEIHARLLTVLRERFEIVDPGLNDDLREQHGFDSIDAVQLLTVVEGMLEIRLSQQEKKAALELRTLGDVCDWVQKLAADRPRSG